MMAGGCSKRKLEDVEKKENDQLVPSNVYEDNRAGNETSQEQDKKEEKEEEEKEDEEQEPFVQNIERLDYFSNLSALCICSDETHGHRPSCLSGLLTTCERIYKNDLQFIYDNYVNKKEWWTTIRNLEKRTRNDPKDAKYVRKLVTFAKKITALKQHYHYEIELSVFTHENMTMSTRTLDMARTRIKHLLHTHFELRDEYPDIARDIQKYKTKYGL